MRKNQLRALLIFLAFVAVMFVGMAYQPAREAAAAPLYAITRFFQMSLSASASGNSGVILRVNQRFAPTGTTTATPPGKVLQLEYKGTPVWRIDHNGNLILKQGAEFATETATPTATNTITPTATP